MRFCVGMVPLTTLGKGQEKEFTQKGEEPAEHRKTSQE